MGKRSKFKRNPRDYYVTPESAVIPLIKHLVVPTTARGHIATFAEPCAGDGSLTRHLIKYGFICGWQSDIEPQHDDVFNFDALELIALDRVADVIVSNPPWEKRKYKGELFNRLLRHWLETFNGDIWLLFDSDWMHTKQALEFSKYCKKVVSVGRVSWMGNGVASLDNCSWYCFNVNNKKPVRFYWRNNTILSLTVK